MQQLVRSSRLSRLRRGSAYHARFRDTRHLQTLAPGLALVKPGQQAEVFRQAAAVARRVGATPGVLIRGRSYIAAGRSPRRGRSVPGRHLRRRDGCVDGRSCGGSSSTTPRGRSTQTSGAFSCDQPRGRALAAPHPEVAGAHQSLTGMTQKVQRVLSFIDAFTAGQIIADIPAGFQQPVL